MMPANSCSIPTQPRNPAPEPSTTERQPRLVLPSLLPVSHPPGQGLLTSPLVTCWGQCSSSTLSPHCG